MVRISRRGIMRAAVSWAALIACTGGLAACGSSSSTTSKSSGSAGSGTTKAAAAKTTCPVNVLLVANLTGAGSGNGQADSATAKATVASINKSGGVLGCPVKLTIKDDGSDYTKDVPITEAALSSGTKYADIIEGDFGCAETTGVITRAKILEITSCGLPGPSNPQYNPTIFDMLTTSDRQGAAIAPYMLAHGCTKIAAVTDNTALGTGEYNAMVSAVGASHLVAHEPVSLAGINFTPAVLAARAANPNCLFYDLYGAAAGHFLTDLKTSGWNIPTYFGSATAATNLQQLGVPESQLTSQKGVDFAGGGYPSTPAVSNLLNSLKAAGLNVDLDALAYTGTHDGLMLFKWAADQTGSLNGTTVAQKLAQSGSVAIPGLAQGSMTGFSTSCHQFAPPNGLIVVRGGYFNEARLPFVAQLKMPNLPCAKPLT